MDERLLRWRSVAIVTAVVVGALLVYASSKPAFWYDHFVWQAEAFLDGQTAIRYPVGPDGALRGNAYFQDILPIGDPGDTGASRGLIPFPPLPAILLVPFVAVWGLATDQQLIASILGALSLGLAWWMLGLLRVRQSIRLVTTIFFGFGTVFWYASQLGTTWFFAHVVAVSLLLLAVGLALRHDPESIEEEPVPTGAGRIARDWIGELRRPWRLIDGRQFVVGFLFGLAGTARLTVLFGAPFFVLVGSGGSLPRRAVSAGLGAALPVGALLLYNLASTGHLFHPAYEYLYQLEARFYPQLGYNPAWSIEDPRYILQNLGIMLFAAPSLLPDMIPTALGAHTPLCTDPGAVRGLFDPDCPLALPSDIGMSIFLTSPAFLLAIPALRLHGRSRLVTGAVLAVALIAVANLMHFSQGWVQFGYRFSNDFIVFMLLLVAIGLARRGGVGILALILVAASVAINAWGVYWGREMGW
jgi:hypothetical protein